MSDAIETPAGEGRRGPWKQGQSGNPAGRPKGSRNKLREQFFKDLLEDWEAHGKEAISTFRADRPHEYVKVVASVLPKELNVKVNELEDLSDVQLAEQLNALARELRASGFDPFAGDEAAPGPDQTLPLSSVQ